MKKDHKQALLAARVAVKDLGAARAQEGPGRRLLEEETEGSLSNTESPCKSRQHPQKHLNRHSEDLCMMVDSAQQKGVPRSWSPTQRVGQCRAELWTWARLCTKEVLQKSTEALAAAVHAEHRITVWRGEARTYLRHMWTEGLLDCRGHLDPAPVLLGPRSSR
ncbi:hypothetical protein NDU88_005314 [Pleurodeles waltl]|uniref:Uncharacterized protein n=1 Tax=Pleurodeles waltl TaxID=8319 RepID=A0AAV7LKZ7_PLEWA|nr:hypothetical protein NDU88_005314 [Pleurodeles waltl]